MRRMMFDSDGVKFEVDLDAFTMTADQCDSLAGWYGRGGSYLDDESGMMVAIVATLSTLVRRIEELEAQRPAGKRR